MKKLITICAVVALTVSLCPVQSKGSVTTLLGPDEWVHVGDSTPSGWPASVGSAWVDTFTLSVAPSADGLLAFEHIEADLATDSVLINGVLIGMLSDSDGVIDRDPTIPTNWAYQELLVPMGALQVGINTIRVESGVSFPGSSFPLDDFMLKDMTHTVDVIPAPGAILLGGIGIGLVGWLRRRKTL